MSVALADAICAALPGAQRSLRAEGEIEGWKIGGKLFAIYGRRGGGVSVKTADTATARMLIDAGEAVRAPYVHASWVRLEWPADPEALRHRLLVSYDIVRAGLPKALRSD